MKKLSMIALVFLLLTSTLTGCSTNDKSEKSNKEASETSGAKSGGKELNLISMAEIPSLDSSKATDAVSMEVMNNVNEGLYRLDQNNQPTPGVAESSEVSPDGKTYTFKLRDSKWSNGEPVTAEDFVFAWRRAVDPNTAAEYAFILYDVKNAAAINEGKMALDQLGVTAVDEKTLKVELENPVPYFLQLTSFATYLPINEKFYTEKGENYGKESDSVLYNGPFTLSEWKHEQSYTMSKNANYWDNSTVQLDKIVFKIVKDTSSAVNLYESGAIDRVPLSAEFVDKFKSNNEYGTELNTRLYFLRFNNKNEALANVNLRKAISLAYEKEDIASVILNNGSLPAYYLVPSNFVTGPDGADFRSINGDLNKTNVAEAQKLWEQAKKELGVDKVTVKFLNYDDGENKKIGEYIKEQVEKNLPGVTLEINQQPYKQKLDLETKLDYEMSLARWAPDYPDPMTFVDMFITDSPFNQMAYSNPKYDELIAQAKGPLLLQPQDRWNAMAEAEKILFDTAGISPVYQQGVAFVQKPYVKNIVKHTFGGDYSYKWATVEK